MCNTESIRKKPASPNVLEGLTGLSITDGSETEEVETARSV